MIGLGLVPRLHSTCSIEGWCGWDVGSLLGFSRRGFNIEMCREILCPFLLAFVCCHIRTSYLDCGSLLHPSVMRGERQEHHRKGKQEIRYLKLFILQTLQSTTSGLSVWDNKPLLFKTGGQSLAGWLCQAGLVCLTCPKKPGFYVRDQGGEPHCHTLGKVTHPLICERGQTESAFPLSCQPDQCVLSQKGRREMWKLLS